MQTAVDVQFWSLGHYAFNLSIIQSTATGQLLRSYGNIEGTLVDVSMLRVGCGCFIALFLGCGENVLRNQFKIKRAKHDPRANRALSHSKCWRRTLRRQNIFMFFSFISTALRNSFVLTSDRIAVFCLRLPAWLLRVLEAFFHSLSALDDIKEEVVEFIREWLSIPFNCCICFVRAVATEAQRCP